MNLPYGTGKHAANLTLMRFILVFFSVFHGIPPDAFSDSEKSMVYFYSSETNINNFVSLKKEFDGYLSGFGRYEFQPFESREVFEAHVKDKGQCLVFLSSWHYSKIHLPLSLKPIFVGTREGKDRQKRILVTGTKTPDLSALKKGPIASASSIQHTKSVLTGMFEKGIPDSVRILTVPKDIDALMSVGFQVSKAALVTEHALSGLKILDPVLHSQMNIQSEGKDSLLLVLAAPESYQEKVQQLIDAIKNMPDKQSGMNVLKMFELDGWKSISSKAFASPEG